MQLLTLALEFFEKHNASCNAADAQPHEFMRDLEMRIMVLSSSAADTKEVELPTTPLARGGMDPAMMEKIIEPLLNTGQLEKVRTARRCNSTESLNQFTGTSAVRPIRAYER